jgi:hypothetical protein
LNIPNLGRTYGSFGSKEISPGHHHDKLLIDTLEIRCHACGNESPQSERRYYPIHVLLHDRGQWEFVPVNPTVNAKATGAKAFELASTRLPQEWGMGEPNLANCTILS